MKKLILSGVLLVALSTATFAQFVGGIRAGLNLSNVSTKVDAIDYDENGDMKVGFQLGLYFVGNLGEKIAIQPELVYSTMGAKSDDVGDTKLGYIAIPVLLRYNINEMLNIHLGPQFNILTSAKDEDDNDFKDDLKSLDTGVTLGVGLDFDAFNAGVRYYAGLTDYSDVDGVEVKNSAIQLIVGYRLFGGE